MLGLAGQIKVQDGSVTVDRVIEEGRQSVSAKLPVVISVVQSIGEPRYPSFMGIRKASKANIPVWSLSDIGASAPEAIVKRTELMNPPVRETAVEIISGESPAEIADTLADTSLRRPGYETFGTSPTSWDVHLLRGGAGWRKLCTVSAVISVVLDAIANTAFEPGGR